MDNSLKKTKELFETYSQLVLTVIGLLGMLIGQQLEEKPRFVALVASFILVIAICYPCWHKIVSISEIKTESTGKLRLRQRIRNGYQRWVYRFQKSTKYLLILIGVIAAWVIFIASFGLLQKGLNEIQDIPNFEYCEPSNAQSNIPSIIIGRSNSEAAVNVDVQVANYLYTEIENGTFTLKICLLDDVPWSRLKSQDFVKRVIDTYSPTAVIWFEDFGSAGSRINFKVPTLQDKILPVNLEEADLTSISKIGLFPERVTSALAYLVSRSLIAQDITQRDAAIALLTQAVNPDENWQIPDTSNLSAQESDRLGETFLFLGNLYDDSYSLNAPQTPAEDDLENAIQSYSNQIAIGYSVPLARMNRAEDNIALGCADCEQQANDDYKAVINAHVIESYSAIDLLINNLNNMGLAALEANDSATAINDFCQLKALKPTAIKLQAVKQTLNDPALSDLPAASEIVRMLDTPVASECTS